MIKIEARKRAFPVKSPIEVIDVPKLSAEEFEARRQKVGLTMPQLTMLTDISRQRISRVVKGDPASMMSDEDGTLFVPRALTLALMGVEAGTYVKQ